MEAEIRYKNPYYRKSRNSFFLEVACSHCKNAVAVYEKAGRGNLIKMQLVRIRESQVDLEELEGQLSCPFCDRPLAKKADYRGRPALWIIRGSVNTRKL